MNRKADFSQAEIMGEDKRGFDIQFHAGYRGEEAPRAVILWGRSISVSEILEIRRLQDNLTGKRCDVFTCRLASAISGSCSRVEIRVFPQGRFEIRLLE